MFNFLKIIGVLIGFSLPINAETIAPKIQQLAESNQLIMFGELHGTLEMVNQFAGFIGALSVNKKPLKIGIEHPKDQLPVILKYIHSAGTAADKRALAMSSYWAKPYQDGRTSQAMLNLLEQIRLLKTQGHDLQVFVFDEQVNVGRESAMAAHVVTELVKDPDVLHILLTGNLHSRTALGSPWDSSFKAMGLYIAEQFPKTASVMFIHSGGDAWLCTTDCKKTLFEPRSQAVLFQLESAEKESNHQFQFGVGTISTSFPAYLSYQPE